jgi:translation initiation factor IF-1
MSKPNKKNKGEKPKNKVESGGKPKEDLLPMEGTVVEAVKGSRFRVRLDNSEHIVLCHLGGKLRKHYIKVVPGDKVDIEVTPYDLTRGRIIYRHR